MTTPYDEYAEKCINGGYLSLQSLVMRPNGWQGEWHYDFSESELREVLKNAWMAGLNHSLKLIEGVKNDTNNSA
jgi:hypothetical protein